MCLRRKRIMALILLRWCIFCTLFHNDTAKKCFWPSRGIHLLILLLFSPSDKMKRPISRIIMSSKIIKFKGITPSLTFSALNTQEHWDLFYLMITNNFDVLTECSAFLELAWALAKTLWRRTCLRKRAEAVFYMYGSNSVSLMKVIR